jgi:hypothetical protein
MWHVPRLLYTHRSFFPISMVTDGQSLEISIRCDRSDCSTGVRAFAAACEMSLHQPIRPPAPNIPTDYRRTGQLRNS